MLLGAVTRIRLRVLLGLVAVLLDLLPAVHTQQAPTPGRLVQVDGAMGLQNAIRRGSTYVIVNDHLDLRTLPVSRCGYEFEVDAFVTEQLYPTGDIQQGLPTDEEYGEVDDDYHTRPLQAPEPILCVTYNTHALLGNCSGRADGMEGLSGAALLPALPRQCLLLTSRALLHVRNGEQRFWFAHMYVRVQPAAAGNATVDAVYVYARTPGLSPQIWMSDVTLQGSGDTLVRGVFVEVTSNVAENTSIHLEGCVLDHLRAGEDGGGAGVIIKKTGMFKDTVFQNCATHREPVPYASAVSVFGGAAAFENCTFQNNTEPQVQREISSAGEAVVYSDVPGQTFAWYDEQEGALVEVPMLPLAEVAATEPFLDPDDPWLQRVQEVTTTGVLPAIDVPAPERVTTTGQLNSALMAGSAYILVQDHLSLRGLNVRSCTTDPSQVGYQTLLCVLTPTKAIQGMCSTAPASSGEFSTSPIRHWRARQCLILAHTHAFDVVAGEQTLWIDSLYVRIDRATNAGEFQVHLVYVSKQTEGWGPRLWLTNTTLQGDGRPGVGAIWLFNGATSSLVAADSMIADMVLPCGAAAQLSNGTRMNLLRCNVTNNFATSGVCGVVHLRKFAAVRLSGTALEDSSPEFVSLEDVDASVWSDNVSTVAMDLVTETPVRVLSLAPSSDSNFLSFQDPDFMAILQGAPARIVVPEDAYPEAAPAAPPPPAGSSSGPSVVPVPSDDRSTAMIVVLVVVAVTVVVVAVCLAARVKRRQKAAQLEKQRADDTQTAPLARPSWSRPLGSSEPWSDANSKATKSNQEFDTAMDTFDEFRGPPISPPALPRASTYAPSTRHVMSSRVGTASLATATQFAGSTVERPRIKRHVVQSLINNLADARRSGELFLGKYQILSHKDSRMGGQSFVQFMFEPRRLTQLAVKFFFENSDFVREVQIYNVPELRSMMPPVYETLDNSEGTEAMLSGAAYPSFIITELGQSLDEWLRSVDADFITTVQSLTLIAQRLAQLHAAGWVHRDLKPGNVLRMPSTHSWTLLDFGCAACVDTYAPLQFTIQYAAPEVIVRYEANMSTMLVSSALDMWSFGIVAYEMLTGDKVFDRKAQREDIMDALVARAYLPWEDPVADSSKLRKLRVLKKQVLSCLSRDARQRPSAAQLVRELDRLYDPGREGSDYLDDTLEVL